MLDKFNVKRVVEFLRYSLLEQTMGLLPRSFVWDKP
jgi:hypothetical protein